MSTIVETLDEGTDETLTVNHPSDTSGLTLTAKLFERNGTGDWTAGTASGAAADTDIDITLDLKSREPGWYILEVWADIGNANSSRDLILPDPEDTLYIRIVDRKQI